MVETRVIRLRVIEGPNARDQTELCTFHSFLGTSHNLSWRGWRVEGGGEIGGPSVIFGWNMGGLKLPKDDLGGVFKFLLSSIPTEQHDA